VGGLQAESLSAESIPSQTLESSPTLQRTSQNALVVVDEAGVVSIGRYQLLKRAENQLSHLAGWGHQAVISSQGNPFGYSDASRFGRLPILEHAAEGRATQRYLCGAACQPKPLICSTLKKIREIPTEDQRIEALVDDYLTRPIEQRRNTLLWRPPIEAGHLAQVIKRQTTAGELLASLSRLRCCKERPG